MPYLIDHKARPAQKGRAACAHSTLLGRGESVVPKAAELATQPTPRRNTQCIAGRPPQFSPRDGHPATKTSGRQGSRLSFSEPASGARRPGWSLRPRARRRLALRAGREIHVESRETYGARRVRAALRRRGIRVGRKARRPLQRIRFGLRYNDTARAVARVAYGRTARRESDTQRVTCAPPCAGAHGFVLEITGLGLTGSMYLKALSWVDGGRHETSKSPFSSVDDRTMFSPLPTSVRRILGVMAAGALLIAVGNPRHVRREWACLAGGTRRGHAHLSWHPPLGQSALAVHGRPLGANGLAISILGPAPCRRDSRSQCGLARRPGAPELVAGRRLRRHLRGSRGVHDQPVTPTRSQLGRSQPGGDRPVTRSRDPFGGPSARLSSCRRGSRLGCRRKAEPRHAADAPVDEAGELRARSSR